MILDASNKHTGVFNIDCSVEELIQVIATVWTHLLPDGAILSLSYNGRCGNGSCDQVTSVNTLVVDNVENMS